jgi:hypothetical protein
VISVEQRQLAVVEYTSERAQLPDLLDKCVLRGGGSLVAGQLVEVAQRSDE